MAVQAELSAYERLTAHWMLAPWFVRGNRGWMDTLLRALGDEIDDGRAQLRDIAAQGFVPTATWTLADWERQLGLPVDEALSTEDRRQQLLERILARRLGFGGAAMRRMVRTLTAQTALPSLTVKPGRWAVFKLGQIGWPGDARFLETERRLYRSMPAAFGGQVAPWDTGIGLTFHQGNLMGFAALDVLTYAELNGGFVVPITHPDAFIVGLGMLTEEQEE